MSFFPGNDPQPGDKAPAPATPAKPSTPAKIVPMPSDLWILAPPALWIEDARPIPFL